ncbi:MAG: hypothetical protein H7Y42_09050 [Chitinophagaceae bacterium]|nr:hypothetical protein [Chitinophagaceae bacterium]
MNEEKVNGNPSLEDESQQPNDGRRRISYVSKDLKTMIDFVAKVYNQLGHTTYHSNKAIATAHGLSPDSIKLQLSSGQQYKLLELKHGTGYKVHDHFQKLYLPRNEDEKRSAVIESLKNPETYQQLFKDYEYHVVPQEGVKNHFIRSFGLREEIATKAAQIFMDNLQEFELLDSRGVLTSAMPSKPVIPTINGKDDEKSDPGGQQDNSGDGQKNHLPTVIHSNEYTENSKYENHIWIPIHITKGQTAVFAYPKEITENDIKIVEHQLGGILLRIRLENEEKNKGDESPK